MLNFIVPAFKILYKLLTKVYNIKNDDYSVNIIMVNLLEG